jgi:hypothetical protein
VECQAFCGATGELYTLIGDLSGLTNREEVYNRIIQVYMRNRKQAF